MTLTSRIAGSLVLCIAAAAPAAGAELYKWVDERGVTNYSNNPPPKTLNGNAAVIVEDRLSVYSPSKSVTDAIEREKDRRARATHIVPPPVPRERDHRIAPVPPPPPPVTSAPMDPCAMPGHPDCQVYLYDHSPVFAGRRRPPRLIQPQLPPGAIAGQVTGSSGFIPGLSASAPPAVPRTRERPQTAPRRDLERETTRR